MSKAPAKKAPAKTTATVKSPDLGTPVKLALADIALDPNNPRIAPKPAPGYGDPSKIFDEQVQDDLVVKVYTTYKAADLENSIIDQGWTPVDQILVWPHPSGKGHIVVEGNTRVSLLKRLPERLERERRKLERMVKTASPKSLQRQQEILIAKIEQLIADTATLWVYPVNAGDADELREKLPRLLGVRHVVPAKGWGPYASNLYIISLYEDAFAKRYGDDEPLRIEPEILARVAEQLPLNKEKIRKQIQAVSAFSHFRQNYEEEIEEAGNKLLPEDQYFFDNILANKHAREEFGFKPDDLELSEEAEAALFKWAFAKKRKGDPDDPDATNENVFQKAEDIRLWQKISRYDTVDAKGLTNFAGQLSIANPDEATPVWQINRQADSHRERNTPVKAFDELLKGLKDLKVDTLLVQAEHLRPMLVEAAKQVKKYIDVIDSHAEKGKEADLDLRRDPPRGLGRG